MDQGLKMRLLLTAQGEWNVYACGVLAQRLLKLGCEVYVAHQPLLSEINYPFSSSWQGPVLPLSPEQLATSDLTRHVDAIGIFAESAVVSQFQQVHRMACGLAGHPRVPIFTGPALPLSGDLLEEDLLGRLGSDLICLHGSSESEVLVELCRFSGEAQPAHLELGLWQTPDLPEAESADHEAANSFVFIEQADFPASSVNRKRLLDQLENMAKLLPNWNFIIQPDYGQPENVKQLKDNSLARLLLTKKLKPRPELPVNLVLGGAGGLPRILANATITATLTSATALAALKWGQPLLLLADYGFSSACNSQLWLGSGLTGRLASISSAEELLELPAAHAGWFDALGGGIQNGAERLLHSLKRLTEVSQA